MFLAYVLVVEVPQQLDLPERALGVHVVVEGVGDLLDGHHLPCLKVHHRAALEPYRFFLFILRIIINPPVIIS